MKIPPPKNGCLILHLLRRVGQRIPGAMHPQLREVFDGISGHVQGNDLMSFYARDDFVKGELCDYTRMRPPYHKQWIEIVDDGDARFGYYVSTFEDKTRPEGDRHCLNIAAYQFAPNRDTLPIAAACVNFRLNDDGDGRIDRVGDVYTPLLGEARNRDLSEQMIHACVKVLRRMNYTNVGFYCERNPDAENLKLPRILRRAADAQRYHVLTIRNEADMRAGRKVVDRKGVMPEHWSRGHLQHNGPASVHGHPDGRDRGLAFGWLAGRFWIKPSAKGDRKNGKIIKDYKLADPERPKRLRRQLPRSPDQPTPDVMSVAAAFQRNEQPPEVRQ